MMHFNNKSSDVHYFLNQLEEETVKPDEVAVQKLEVHTKEAHHRIRKESILMNEIQST